MRLFYSYFYVKFQTMCNKRSGYRKIWKCAGGSFSARQYDVVKSARAVTVRSDACYARTRLIRRYDDLLLRAYINESKCQNVGPFDKLPLESF